MIYVTEKLQPRFHQMTLDEYLYDPNAQSKEISFDSTSTRTYELERFGGNHQRYDIPCLIQRLVNFNQTTAHLHEADRHSLYREFYIPKKSGGLRKIDAPNPELMEALRVLKLIFENDFGSMYHTSAFAYVHGRNTVRAMQRHQMNESRWFAKFDLHNFFGSITPEFAMKMLSMIYPFSEIVKSDVGKNALSTAIDLGFLDGGLPQGTPLSPTLTNIIMIPIDYKLSNTLRSFKNQRYVYTRYADDFQISSKYPFRFMDIEQLILDTITEFNAPLILNRQKTRYGSSSGSNWNLGLMLNRENQLTIGYQQKRRFLAMLSAYVMDKKNGVSWDLYDVQVMHGQMNYYKSVNEESVRNSVSYINKRFNVDLISMIMADLRRT